MRLRLIQRSQRRPDERVGAMLDRHVREQRSAAAIVTPKPELRRRIADLRVG